MMLASLDLDDGLWWIMISFFHFAANRPKVTVDVGRYSSWLIGSRRLASARWASFLVGSSSMLPSSSFLLMRFVIPDGSVTSSRHLPIQRSPSLMSEPCWYLLLIARYLSLADPIASGSVPGKLDLSVSPSECDICAIIIAIYGTPSHASRSPILRLWHLRHPE